MSTVGVALFACVALCGAGIALALLAPARFASRIVAWTGALAAAALVIAGGSALLAPAVYEQSLWNIPATGDLVVRVDALSGLFLLVTGLVYLPVSVFAVNPAAYLGSYSRRDATAALYLALLLSVVWILIAADVYSFVLAWEMMSICCYLFVNLGEKEGALRGAGYVMLAVGEAGTLAAALGLLLLARPAHSLAFADLHASAETLGIWARWLVFLLTFFGFGVKAGLVPVNFWLPRAYTAAPAGFVPVLAGVTMNLGLYGIVRVNGVLLSVSSIGPGVVALIVGTASALVGILYATVDNDLKTVLAHSSIENAGIITIGFGAGFLFTAEGLPALAGIAYLVALYHLVNHSMYKALLFVGAGVVESRSGARNLDLLGGLIRQMPWTAAFVLAGVLSIAALPPFNGFVSEWLLFQTLLRSAELPTIGVKIVVALCGAGLALTAALAVTCFVKVFAMGFLGMARSSGASHATEATMSARLPMAALGALCLLLGVLPTYVIGALDGAVRPIASGGAAAALVPPIFDGSAGHTELPAAFLAEFHDLGAQVGEHLAPGPGLVMMHRGGTSNPVIFAGAPSYLLPVLVALLLLAFAVVYWLAARHRTVTRRACWDGGIQRLLPEMTYTATGFSNPVRVIFQSIFRPTLVADTRATVAEHFRTAIFRESEEVHIVDRLVLRPWRDAALSLAHRLARIHHGRLNAYAAYVLVMIVLTLALSALL